MSERLIDRREHPLLCEQQFGLFDGLSNKELEVEYPREHAYYAKCEAKEGRFWARMPLGESRFDVAVRVHQAFGTFQRDSEEHRINNIIVVCHGVTLRAFRMMWCHYTPEWFEAEPNPANASIWMIDHYNVDVGCIFPGFDREGKLNVDR
jgi:broad specificity phosphatase PhoE